MDRATICVSGRQTARACVPATAWRTVGYLRLSHDDGFQVESDSIQAQRRIVEDWARRRGDVELTGFYIDDGFSGASFDRPGFMQMVEDARCGLFDTIAVKDLSRFGRSYLDCGSWIERELPRMGVRLYSIADDFDSMARWDLDTALLFPMKNLMNEMHVVATSQKVRTVLAAKRERGEFVGSFAPYGYVKDPLDRHRLVVDEASARVVRRIFSMRLAGTSASAIARTLNSEGVPSPAEAKRQMGLGYKTCFCDGSRRPRWHPKAVLRILRDETYTGVLVQGRTARASWRAREGAPVPKEEWTRVAGTHEPIVDRTTFEAVSRLVGEDGGAGAGGVANGTCGAGRGGEREGGEGGSGSGESAGGEPGFSTFLDIPISVQFICHDCGASMKRIKVSSGKRSYIYYVCARHRKNPRACSPHSVREESLVRQLELMEASGCAPGVAAAFSIDDRGRLHPA